MAKFKKFVLLFLLLSGCTSNEVSVATPIPTPDVWQVAYSSELSWLVPMFGECLETDSGTTIVVEESPTMQVAGMQAELMLHWGEIDPLGFSAYHLGEDQIVVVTNRANPLEVTSILTFQQIYQGEITEWSSISSDYAGAIHAWVYPDYLPIERLFSSQVMEQGLNRTSFNIAPDVEAMLEAIQNDPLGIGFIPGLWQDSRVKRFELSDGLTLSAPVVLISPQELSPEKLSWLDCLQRQFPPE